MLGDISGVSKIFLIYGRDSRKIKALYFDKTGFVLMQKRLDGTGRFQWSRTASEARFLSSQEFRWLMEGFSIDQPKAIRAGGRKKEKDQTISDLRSTVEELRNMVTDLRSTIANLNETLDEFK